MVRRFFVYFCECILQRKSIIMTKKATERPLHPFPLLISGRCVPTNTPMTAAERDVLLLLKNGNRIVFDIQEKRGLIYRFSRGIETVMEISVRMLAALVKKCGLIPVSREGKFVHFILVGGSTWWYDPEEA